MVTVTDDSAHTYPDGRYHVLDYTRDVDPGTSTVDAPEKLAHIMMQSDIQNALSDSRPIYIADPNALTGDPDHVATWNRVHLV